MTIDFCEREDESLDVPRYIYVNFWDDRSCGNKILYAFYRILKCIYTSAWFYFMPYATVICSYVILLSHHDEINNHGSSSDQEFQPKDTAQ